MIETVITAAEKYNTALLEVFNNFQHSGEAFSPWEPSWAQECLAWAKEDFLTELESLQDECPSARVLYNEGYITTLIVEEDEYWI